ncbi:MAG TPA: class I SAM-dependent methyltransferase [Thermoleophilaceae bacterium]
MARPGWKIAVYRAALRRHSQLQEVTSALLVGLFLGLLDADDRVRIDEEYYDNATGNVDGVSGRYDDETMVDRGLADWERAAVEEHFRAGDSVIVLGAGAGREVLALLEAGFDARGYDPHPRLVERGSQLLAERGHPNRLDVSERSSLPADSGEADAVVLGWGMYTLIAGRSARVALLRQMAERLRPGSPVLLSFFPAPPRARQLRIAHALARALSRLRGARPPELGDWLMPNFVHLFTEDDIRAEAGEAGFDLRGWWSEPYGHAIATRR